MKQWKAYRGRGGDWELYDLAKDVEEQHDIAKEQPDVLQQLTAFAKDSHEPMRPGKVYDRQVIEKDRRQAPHKRKPKPSKPSKQ